MIYYSKVTEKGNSSYSFVSQEAAEDNAKFLDDNRCVGCMNCKGCTDCKDCKDCKDCMYCMYCTDCEYCAYRVDCNGDTK